VIENMSLIREETENRVFRFPQKIYRLRKVHMTFCDPNNSHGRNNQMAKKILSFIKLQIPAGQANPSPPVGPALGQHGVNIMEFCKAFNAKTQDEAGMIIPVVITVYADRSFSFITKTPPAAVLLRKAAGIEKGSGEPNKVKVGKVTKSQVEEIARTKMPDLNAYDVEEAMVMIEGTARRMGIGVEGPGVTWEEPEVVETQNGE